MDKFQLTYRKEDFKAAIFGPSFLRNILNSKKRRRNYLSLLMMVILGWYLYQQGGSFDFAHVIVGAGLVYFISVNLQDALVLFRWQRSMEKFATESERYQESIVGITDDSFVFSWKQGREKRFLSALVSARIEDRFIQLKFPSDFYFFPAKSFADDRAFQRFCALIQAAEDANNEAPGPTT